jgi:hypothetical protein
MTRREYGGRRRDKQVGAEGGHAAAEFAETTVSGWVELAENRGAVRLGFGFDDGLGRHGLRRGPGDVGPDVEPA